MGRPSDFFEEDDLSDKAPNRPGVYMICIVGPRGGVRENVYVGQTTRSVRARLKEHLDGRSHIPIDNIRRRAKRDGCSLKIQTIASDDPERTEKYMLKTYDWSENIQNN